MKISVKYLIIAILLVACNEEKSLLAYSQEKADQFVEKYAAEFLSDEELLRYNYHPRAQFTNVQDSTNNYRIFPRETEIRLICFSDSCELTEPFNNSSLKLLNGSYTLKRDSIVTEIRYDSSIVKIHSFKINPEDYFDALKKRLEKFGVFAYSETKDKSAVKVYLSVQYYLIHSKDVQKNINKDEILKSYDNNWYFVKMKRQMDLG